MPQVLIDFRDELGMAEERKEEERVVLGQADVVILVTEQFLNPSINRINRNRHQPESSEDKGPPMEDLPQPITRALQR